MRPLVGITSSYTESDVQSLPANYVAAVESAGGVPLIIPAGISPELVDDLLGTVDALLLSGGPDVDPAFFGEPPHPRLGSVSPQRDMIEIPLARAAVQLGKPVLAICRGIQVLNVALGGTLYQDIGSQIPGALKHRQEAPRWHGTHDIAVDEDSRLVQLLGSAKIKVNTYHHQCVRDVASQLKVVARAPDGVIEGVEKPGSFVVGVQWHPECMYDKTPAFRGLFRGLVKAVDS